MAISKSARTFKDLLVWQKAHRFVLEAYAFTAALEEVSRLLGAYAAAILSSGSRLP
jgi:hypothetical protein